jgi:hypothetical protein
MWLYLRRDFECRHLLCRSLILTTGMVAPPSRRWEPWPSVPPIVPGQGFLIFCAVSVGGLLIRRGSTPCACDRALLALFGPVGSKRFRPQPGVKRPCAGASLAARLGPSRTNAVYSHPMKILRNSVTRILKACHRRFLCTG